MMTFDEYDRMFDIEMVNFITFSWMIRICSCKNQTKNTTNVRIYAKYLWWILESWEHFNFQKQVENIFPSHFQIPIFAYSVWCGSITVNSLWYLHLPERDTIIWKSTHLQASNVTNERVISLDIFAPEHQTRKILNRPHRW